MDYLYDFLVSFVVVIGLLLMSLFKYVLPN
jgi:divalent metal cation (Fe/Co/Zn/Cd) transporter